MMPIETSERRPPDETSAASAETEPTAEGEGNEGASISFSILQADLQQNYSDHLRAIENASIGMLDGVVHCARTGFQVSLVLNVLSFLLGFGVIAGGLVMLLRSPEDLGRLVGMVSSLVGLILVITLLFWKGPLDRILESVANLARINAVTIGLAHRLNQISSVFVQESLRGKMTLRALGTLNRLIDEAVHRSAEEFQILLPRQSAEDQVQRVVTEAGFSYPDTDAKG